MRTQAFRMTNEDAYDAIMGIIYAEAKRRSDAITLPRAAYQEIPPAYVVDAASKRGRADG
ncbi:hypothetical protein [Paracoccus sp. SY]|uniref:hypothetical protein n=1 Tax=Paracoccus sp. SY TaxID=1330255 RepID=UPI0011AEDBDC|nr:hypothetical protein [Paracoccus sp. SY]